MPASIRLSGSNPLKISKPPGISLQSRQPPRRWPKATLAAQAHVLDRCQDRSERPAAAPPVRLCGPRTGVKLRPPPRCRVSRRLAACSARSAVLTAVLFYSCVVTDPRPWGVVRVAYCAGGWRESRHARRGDTATDARWLRMLRWLCGG